MQTNDWAWTCWRCKEEKTEHPRAAAVCGDCDVSYVICAACDAEVNGVELVTAELRTHVTIHTVH